MKPLLSILLALLTVTACNNKTSKTERDAQTGADTITSEVKDKQPEQDPVTKVDQVYIGMTIQELKETYKNATFIEEPVYEYGIDGDSNGLVVEQDNERLFFVWTLLGKDEIHGITLLSESLKIDDDVHVGMTLEAFRDKYPNIPVNIDMLDDRYEYLYVPEHEYRVEFLTTDSTRVATYDYDQPEPEFKAVKRPHATVDRISFD